MHDGSETDGVVSQPSGDEVRLEANVATLLSPELHRTKTGTATHEGAVPTFVPDWLPGADNCKNFRTVLTIRRQSAVEPAQNQIRTPARDTKPHALVRAYEFQKLLDDGVVNSRAEIARRYGISRARVTQVMSLLRLSRPVREQLLALPVHEQARYSERRLRTMLALKTEAARSRAFELLYQAVRSPDGV